MAFVGQGLSKFADDINMKWKYFAIAKRFQPGEEPMIVARGERNDEAIGYRHKFTAEDAQGHYSWAILDSDGDILYMHGETMFVQGPGDMLAYMNPIKIEVIGG
jgi:hypothetical protein